MSSYNLWDDVLYEDPGADGSVLRSGVIIAEDFGNFGVHEKGCYAIRDIKAPEVTLFLTEEFIQPPREDPTKAYILKAMKENLRVTLVFRHLAGRVFPETILEYRRSGEFQQKQWLGDSRISGFDKKVLTDVLFKEALSRWSGGIMFHHRSREFEEHLITMTIYRD